MESLVIYLILLLAIVAGWVLGRFTARNRKEQTRDTGDIFEDYFVGLNYLLNDEPDEAIDTFIKALEINSETFETHLALGALLR
ncbi:MAG TPA: lipopolysaccharide assembly protein LapB, partial [Gammaproteobacteria bacterium]|nr:lipopolysaccharide assembly protein LapB [Gammaproteobacteria bacterium]HAD71723.1 lipopolysaccharide assembly protein LapB [Gammaproteobacteria bacterium]